MGILQSLGLTPRALISKGVGQLFGAIGMPNPMSLMSGGGGGGGNVPIGQGMLGAVKQVLPTVDLTPAPKVGQQRADFEAQREQQIQAPLQNNLQRLTQLTQQIPIQQPTAQPVAQSPQRLLQAVFPTASQNITSQFGNRTQPMPGASTFHQGIDIGGQANDQLRAVMPGKILQVGNNSGLGNYMKMLGDNGMTFTYGHANNFNVKPGQQVTAGQPIGAMGSTGISTGNHLHFMASQDGKYFNPMDLFKQKFGGQ